MRASKRIKCFFLFLVPFFVSPRALDAVQVKEVAVFASEKIMGQWINSYFSSANEGGAEANECEKEIRDAMLDAGINVVPFELNKEGQEKAYALHTVFDRYSDLSSIPNDTALKTAYAVGKNISAAVFCSVVVKEVRKRLRPRMLCAEAGCKVVDASTRLRSATSQDRRCSEPVQDMDSRILMMKDVCRYMGYDLAKKMNEAIK